MEKQLGIPFYKDDAISKDVSNLVPVFSPTKIVTESSWSVFVDGAARGNPGPAGCGIHIIVPQSPNDLEIKKGFYLGKKTNNQAEYIAMLLAVFLVKEQQHALGIKNISLTIYSDSELVIKQMNGFYRVKDSTLLCIKVLVETMLSNLSYKLVHIMREKNKIADRLANLGIDKKIQLPANFCEYIADFKDVVKIIKN